MDDDDDASKTRSNEAIITKADMDERDLEMNDLKQKLRELRLEMDYQLKRKDMSYQEEIKLVTSQFELQIDTLNAKIHELVETKEEHDAKYHAFLEQMSTEQKTTLDGMQSYYNSRLIAEFEKYNELQNILEDSIKNYEGKLKSLDSECELAVVELVEYYENKIKDKSKALDHAFEEARSTITESEEMKKQIEEDADAEILQLTYSYEKKLRKEESTNEKLMADSNILKRNFSAMNRQIDSLKGDVMKLQQEGEKMKTTILMSEKEVQSLRKDLVDRDINVQGKEKVIFDLNKTNSELEKYKFVLDYKIKELKKMIEPKEREIIYLKQQNADMEQELLSTVAVRNGLELQVNELTNKLHVTDREYEIERRLRSRLQVLNNRIRSYMSRCMNVLHDHHSLKVAVKGMYAKYGHTLDLGMASNAEQEAICELVRQKNYLELSLASLKRKIAKEVDATRNEQLKIMHENMMLVFEINNLRRELKLLRDRTQAYEICLGILPSNFNNRKTVEMRMKLQNVIQDKEEVTLQHDKNLQDKQNIIDAQTRQIEQLSDRLFKVQEEAGINQELPADFVLQV